MFQIFARKSRSDETFDIVNAKGQLDAISRSQAVIEFDLDGTIQDANENFLGAVGYRLDEIVGQHHRLFVEPSYAQSSEYAAFWRSLAEGEYQTAEYKRIAKGGREIWIQASYNPIFGADGRPYKVVKYATDITARKRAMNAFAENLQRLADGDLSARVPNEVDGEFAGLRSSFNDTLKRLAEMVGQIQSSSGAIVRSTEIISGGSRDLSSRAESQASSLQQTSATMEEMSASIKANADNAHRADGAAKEAVQKAERGGEVVGSAIAAMERIEHSSSKISEIISVIDSIAFQTNLLALNAAVEAARAGDAGKGFAVVASEMRTLAQRSAEAAKDISALIKQSSGQVSEGAELVRLTGGALTEIHDAIEAVVHNVSDISDASREQALGVAEITTTISHMDSMIQQNSALAEQSAAHARDLSEQAETLRRLVSYFRSGGEAEADAQWSQIDGAHPAPRAVGW